MSTSGTHPALWRGILEGLVREASLRCRDAIGIDTWAVDYGLQDEDGRLIATLRPTAAPCAVSRELRCRPRDSGS